jgi:hypothetical protein
LNDTSGASSEYQHVLVELEALDRTLELLQGHELFQSNVAQINAIRAIVLTCRIPLQEFLKQLEKYENSMGPFATKKASFSAFARKSQWAVLMADDVARLRSTIGAKVLSIQLLLGIHISSSLSRIEAHAHEARDAANADALEHKADIAALCKAVGNSASDQQQSLCRLDNKADSAAVTLGVISSTVARTATTIVTIKDVALQLLLLIREVPQHVREAFEPLVRTNSEIFTMVREIHMVIVRAPSPSREFPCSKEPSGVCRDLSHETYRRCARLCVCIQELGCPTGNLFVMLEINFLDLIRAFLNVIIDPRLEFPMTEDCLFTVEDLVFIGESSVFRLREHAWSTTLRLRNRVEVPELDEEPSDAVV